MKKWIYTQSKEIRHLHSKCVITGSILVLLITSTLFLGTGEHHSTSFVAKSSKIHDARTQSQRLKVHFIELFDFTRCY